MSKGSALSRTLHYFKEADYEEAQVAFAMVQQTMNRRKTSPGHVLAGAGPKAAAAAPAKKMGRKKGSKNLPKDGASAPAATQAQAQAPASQPAPAPAPQHQHQPAPAAD